MSQTLEWLSGEIQIYSAWDLEWGPCDSVFIEILSAEASKACHKHSDQGKADCREGEARSQSGKSEVALERREEDTQVPGFSGLGSRLSGCPAFQIASFMSGVCSKQQIILEEGQCEG